MDFRRSKVDLMEEQSGIRRSKVDLIEEQSGHCEEQSGLNGGAKWTLGRIKVDNRKSM